MGCGQSVSSQPVEEEKKVKKERKSSIKSNTSDISKKEKKTRRKSKSDSMILNQKEQEYQEMKEKYLKDHAIFSKLLQSNNFLDQFNTLKIDLGDFYSEEIVGEFFNSNKDTFKTEGMTIDDLKQLVKEIIAENYINNILKFQNWNLTKLFEPFIKKLENKDFEKNINTYLSNLNLDKSYPSTQKGFHYLLNHGDEYQSINKCLMFNQKFQSTLINIPISSNYFKDLNFINEISRIIEINEDLRTVMVTFILEDNFFDEEFTYDQKALENIDKIFEAIYRNSIKYKKIKTLMISFNLVEEKEKIIDISKNIYSYLIKIIVENPQLEGLGFYQFNFYDNNYNDLFQAIKDSQLKMLLICPPLTYDEKLFDKSVNLISNAKNLNFAVFGNFKEFLNEPTYKNAIEQIKNNKSLRFSYIENLFEFH